MLKGTWHITQNSDKDTTKFNPLLLKYTTVKFSNMDVKE